MNYKDIADEPEDERIRQIGDKVMRERLTVGVLTDSEPGKAERYIAKLKERYPGIRVVYQGPGPVADVTLIKVAPPVN